MKRAIMHRRNERGVALIFALVLVLVLSVIAATLLFVSRTEIWSSANYRMMTQARYGAEAGINSAANYLINNYTPPGTTGADQYSFYTQLSPNTAAVPVTGSAMFATVEYNGNLAALTSGNPSVPFTYGYPAGAGVRTGFRNSVAGTIQSGNDTVSYNAYATLLDMEQLSVYGSPTPVAVQTWLLTADGNINNVQNSQVELSAVLEQKPVPTFEYAAFADSQNCGALTFSGGGTTNSYNSANYGGSGSPTLLGTGGNVGSNGNLNENGGAIINGTMSTPTTGVGKCGQGGNVDAWTDSGKGQVTGGLIQLPQTVNYPTPTVDPAGTQDENLTSGITQLAPKPASQYNNISLSGSAELDLYQGEYDINCLSITGNNASIKLIAVPGSNPPQYGPVVLDVTGNNCPSNIVVQLGGNSVTNSTLIASDFQIIYAGTGEIDLAGNSQASGVVYAPNASIKFVAGPTNTWYGAVIGKTVDDKGGTGINYDQRLQKEAYTLGNWELDTFTWKKY